MPTDGNTPSDAELFNYNSAAIMADVGDLLKVIVQHFVGYYRAIEELTCLTN